MKQVNYLAIIALSFVMVACGGKRNQENEKASDNENEVILNVESQLGEIGQYISVISEDATLRLEEREIGDRKSLKIVGSVIFNVPNAFNSNENFIFKASILDENRIKIAELAHAFEIESESKNDRYVLFPGNIQAEYNFSIPDTVENYLRMWELIKEKGKYLLLKNYFDEAEYSIGSNFSNSVTSETEDEDEWDKLLSQYESLVNKYIAGTKKMKNGDYEVVSDFPALAEKAEKLDIKFHENEDEMSEAQWKRYMDLNTKKAKAMEDLMK